MDDRPGIISITTKARVVKAVKSDGQRLQERLDRLTEIGRKQGETDAACCPIAPPSCRTDLERSAWVDGYMDGYAKAARREVCHG